MKLWRIASQKWALDKTGDGSRENGGRWNPPGTSVVYAGLNIEICALEKFVHLAGVPHPALKLVSISLPDDLKLCYKPSSKQLPKNWAALPIDSSSQDFGKRWLSEAKYLWMMVPSAIIPEARNAVINPLHPDFKSVRFKIVRDFEFDSRMLKTQS